MQTDRPSARSASLALCLCFAAIAAGCESAPPEPLAAPSSSAAAPDAASTVMPVGSVATYGLMLPAGTKWLREATTLTEVEVPASLERTEAYFLERLEPGAKPVKARRGVDFKNVALLGAPPGSQRMDIALRKKSYKTRVTIRKLPRPEDANAAPAASAPGAPAPAPAPE